MEMCFDSDDGTIVKLVMGLLKLSITANAVKCLQISFKGKGQSETLCPIGHVSTTQPLL